MFASRRIVPLSLAVAALATLTSVGCTNARDPLPGSAAYKAGELGNGGFTFSCADTNGTCLEQTNADAKAFPAGVSKGSRFRVRYVPRPELRTAVNVEIDDTSGSGSASASTQGRTGTLETVGAQYLQRGASGFVAMQAGYGTIVARDASGSLIEFTTIPIREAQSLLVYESATATNGNVGPSVLSLSLKPNDQKAFRLVAQDATKQNLGGSFDATWSSSNPAVADIESQDRGVWTLVARTAGSTKIKVAALGLENEIDVQVTE